MPKSIDKFTNERNDILQKILNIQEITEKNKMFSLKELDENNDKQNNIITLEANIKKYFLCSRWTYFSNKNREFKHNYLSLIKAIMKDMNVKMASSTLMNVLDIHNINKLSKDITKNFNNTINNNWLNENIETIKKTFDIRTKKYNDLTYYNIYLLMITILKNLFDIKLFMRKETQINKVKHIYYIIDDMILNNHKSIITKLCSHIDFID